MCILGILSEYPYVELYLLSVVFFLTNRLLLYNILEWRVDLKHNAFRKANRHEPMGQAFKIERRLIKDRTVSAMWGKLLYAISGPKNHLKEAKRYKDEVAAINH